MCGFAVDALNAEILNVSPLILNEFCMDRLLYLLIELRKYEVVFLIYAMEVRVWGRLFDCMG